MEGHNRVAHCLRNSKNGYFFDMSNGVDLMHDESQNPLDGIVLQETDAEEKELLREALTNLTSLQRKVVIECIVNQRTHADVAKELGITRQAVSLYLSWAMRHLRNAFGVES